MWLFVFSTTLADIFGGTATCLYLYLIQSINDAQEESKRKSICKKWHLPTSIHNSFKCLSSPVGAIQDYLDSFSRQENYLSSCILAVYHKKSEPMWTLWKQSLTLSAKWPPLQDPERDHRKNGKEKWRVYLSSICLCLPRWPLYFARTFIFSSDFDALLCFTDCWSTLLLMACFPPLMLQSF